MTNAREKIRQKILADIRKRVDTYWSESQMNDAGFSDTAKAAKEELHKWAAMDLKFLLSEIDRRDKCVPKPVTHQTHTPGDVATYQGGVPIYG